MCFICSSALILQGSVLEELQNRIRKLEEEKDHTQRECVTLQQKVEELRNRVAPEIDTVSHRIIVIGGVRGGGGGGGGAVGENINTQRECVTLQQKVEELRNRVAPEIDTVSHRIIVIGGVRGGGGGAVGENIDTQRECVTLQQKVEELRNRVAPEIDMVSHGGGGGQVDT